MTGAPEDVRRLARDRDRARRERDFETADRLRERIRESGFDVTDTPNGWELRAREPAPPGEEAVAVVRPDDVESLVERATAFDASLQWVVEGWPEDAVRGIESFRRHHGGRSMQFVVADLTGAPDVWPEGVDLVRLPPVAGWGSARNAALRRSAGRIVLLVDGSVEAQGDVLGPLEAALADPSVGVTGPFGIVTDDLRQFRQAPGPECDAVEGYLMAFRRELLTQGVRFDPKFRFYRTADIELSFQIKARGLRVTVTPVPVRRHEHRMWSSIPEVDRDRMSRRNFYRFLDRWRGRTDLLVSNPGEPEAPGQGADPEEAPRR